MDVGTVEAIWRYPVKSLRGERLEIATVAASGIPGDRGSALFVRGGHARTGKTYRGKEHHRLHLTGDPAAALQLGREAGVDVELRSGGEFFDDAPLSLLVDRWMDGLNAHLGYAVEPERFRSNFFVRAAPGFDRSERDVDGTRIEIGEVALRVRSPIERCVAVTYHPHGAPSDPGILRYLAQQRDACLGLYCEVVRAGRVQTGDRVVLVAN